MTSSTNDYDFVVIGGGFYGCCLALLLRSISAKVLLVEAEDALFGRASRVNQARIHTGFHYPRSFLTAMRSMALHHRFAQDFPEAVVDSFEMLYAIARRRSKVSGQRFYTMFKNLGAPIEVAPSRESGLFSSELIDSVYRVTEWGFDYRALAAKLVQRLNEFGVEVRLSARVERVEQLSDGARLEFSGGSTLTAGTVFNVTYAMLNDVLSNSGLELIPLKYELVELALIEPPPDLDGLAVTVMDGPFFSAMPYPSEGLYSLTHVRYTPHFSWVDAAGRGSADSVAKSLPRDSHWKHMVMDSARYMPCISASIWKKSLYDVKTVLVKNEINDARPIFIHRQPQVPSLISIMGGKIDNIYDLMDALPRYDLRWSELNLSCIFPGQS